MKIHTSRKTRAGWIGGVGAVLFLIGTMTGCTTTQKMSVEQVGPSGFLGDTSKLTPGDDEVADEALPPAVRRQVFPAHTPVAAQPYIYPARGQSPQQEESDKGQCYGWAVQQSGFDPANPRVAMPPPPPSYYPQPQAPQGGLFRGAFGGAALGAVGGAIGGDAGKGAAIGAGVGGLFGMMRRHRYMEEEQQTQQEQMRQQQGYMSQEQNALARGLVRLRAPKLFNLRSDPFERAQHEAGDYVKWFVEHLFVFVPAQAIVGQHLETFREFPPRQKPGSFSVGEAMEVLMKGKGGN